MNLNERSQPSCCIRRDSEFRSQPHVVSLLGQSLNCSGPGHFQQEVLPAHCSRQPLIAPLITCS